jgi:hypothetical protein
MSLLFLSKLINRINDRGDLLCWPRDTLYPQKLALTSPTSGGRSVGIVRLRTKGDGVFISLKIRVARQRKSKSLETPDLEELKRTRNQACRQTISYPDIWSATYHKVPSLKAFLYFRAFISIDFLRGLWWWYKGLSGQHSCETNSSARGRPYRILRDPRSFKSRCRAWPAWSAVIHILVTER